MVAGVAVAGLLNRRRAIARIPALVAQTQAQNGQVVALAMDLDRFKAVNDEHGHAVGGLVLVNAAEALRSCLRRADVVSRIGGEEFIARPGPRSRPRSGRELTNRVPQTVVQRISGMPGARGEFLFLMPRQDLSHKPEANPRRRLAGSVVALAMLAAACGTGPSTPDDPAALAAYDAAVANADDLTVSDNVADTDVLDVSDGSISSLRGAIDGDRPVLLWFWAPH